MARAIRFPVKTGDKDQVLKSRRHQKFQDMWTPPKTQLSGVRQLVLAQKGVPPPLLDPAKFGNPHPALPVLLQCPEGAQWGAGFLPVESLGLPPCVPFLALKLTHSSPRCSCLYQPFPQTSQRAGTAPLNQHHSDSLPSCPNQTCLSLAKREPHT